MVLHKAGDVGNVDNWRQLEVPSQLGLLQESVLATRAKGPVRAHLSQGQSGYIRDVSDPQMVLHEISATVI